MLLRQIQHFQTIVQENSFTGAAELCHISQSGISQSIKALEDEIGVQLILRKNRSFELTEAGKHFYKKSLVITADLEQLVNKTFLAMMEKLGYNVRLTYEKIEEEEQ